MQKRILVTGGSGFLGTHLVNGLIENGNQVFVVDQRQPRSSGAQFIKGSFSDPQLIKPLLNKVDIVFHLAAVVGVDYCDDNPEMVNDINIISTKKLIDWSVKAGIQRFIFTSSSEVYGNEMKVPYSEDMSLHPVSGYGKGKKIIEEYLKITTDNSDLSVGVARLFNVYGPGQRTSFVVPIFIQQALSSQDLIIFGDGKQTRSFTYVDDVVAGLIKLMNRESRFEIFNLGNNSEYSMNELAKTILSVIPESKSQVIYKEHGKDGIRSKELEIQRRVPSTEKAKKILEFEATTPLRTGIQKMLQYVSE